jgi:hypothetical protein
VAEVTVTQRHIVAHLALRRVILVNLVLLLLFPLTWSLLREALSCLSSIACIVPLLSLCCCAARHKSLHSALSLCCCAARHQSLLFTVSCSCLLCAGCIPTTMNSLLQMRTIRLDDTVCQLIQTELGCLLPHQDLPGLRTAPDTEPGDYIGTSDNICC